MVSKECELVSLAIEVGRYWKFKTEEANVRECESFCAMYSRFGIVDPFLIDSSIWIQCYIDTRQPYFLCKLESAVNEMIMREE